MRTLFVIGMGAGHPDFLTQQAVNAMRRADVFLTLDKGGARSDLHRAREQLCRQVLGPTGYRLVAAQDVARAQSGAGYLADVDAWHRDRRYLYQRLIEKELGPNDCGALLVWGDPSLYDSTLRILTLLRGQQRPAFDLQVVPGITSVQALAASHQIPLHAVGEPFTVTTGRKLRESKRLAHDVVVMLDGECSFHALLPDHAEWCIYWGAYLGTEQQVILAGPLAQMADQIAVRRAELREQHGWIMDIYALQRHPPYPGAATSGPGRARASLSPAH